MLMTIVRGIIAGFVVMGVTEFSVRFPRIGALLITLPIVGMLAFIMTWSKDGDVVAISRLAKETLLLVPLGLPFFVPIAFCDLFGLSFWAAFAAGVLLAALSIAMWLAFGPTLS
jgi:hypothetical protein